jgi:hypothetical protein
MEITIRLKNSAEAKATILDIREEAKRFPEESREYERMEEDFVDLLSLEDYKELYPDRFPLCCGMGNDCICRD